MPYQFVQNTDGSMTFKDIVSGTEIATVTAAGVIAFNATSITMTREALAALGSTSANGASITKQISAVTASNGTKCVVLPAAATTTGPLLVINTVATAGSTLPVFPVDGGNDLINGEAEDAAWTLGPGQAAWFVPVSATQWYVQPASSLTASTAELQYLDITTLGTGAASKAVVLDSGEDYTWPATGVLTTGVVKDTAGTSLTATHDELNRSCDASARIVTTTATTLSLTVTQHAERIVIINTDSTVANTFSLPAAAGTGAKFTLVNNVAQTQGTIVVAANGTDVMQGVAFATDATSGANDIFLTSATSDKYTFNLTTMGGLGGDMVEAWDIAANTWYVRVFAHGSGTLATGYAAST